MKKLFIIIFIVFSTSMSKSYSQEISIINLPLNSYDTIKKYYHIPNLKKTCDTMVYDFNFVTDTCCRKYLEKDIMLNVEKSKCEVYKNCWLQTDKQCKAYKKELFGITLVFSIFVIYEALKRK